MRLSCYPKIHRFPIHEFGVEGFYRLPKKYYWDKKTSELILGEGRKYVKEKLDGGTAELCRDEYQFFLELLEKRHLIPYTHLTNFTYVYDIWNMDENRFLKFDELLHICEKYSMEMNPVILVSENLISIEFLVSLLGEPSKFNPDHPAEGYIVVNDTVGLTGKITNQIYDDSEENLAKREIIHEKNRMI